MRDAQELGHKIWTIVELFYRSDQVFREQHDSYEKQVKNYSRLTGIDRHDLRLNSAELAGLLDLKSLERLRDEYIHQLKDLCHQVFRGQDRTDLLDRYVSDIFHEISILKEEHYNVKTYAPLYEKDAAEVELRHILDEAHTLFPQKLSHLQYLFGRARVRLEEHLPSFCSFQVFVRSLYVHREDFVRDAYPGGVERFYWLMYPLGPVEGYSEVGSSFYRSGYYERAIEAFDAAEVAYHRRLLEGIAPGLALRSSGQTVREVVVAQRRALGTLLRVIRAQRSHCRLLAAERRGAVGAPPGETPARAVAEGALETPRPASSRASVPVPPGR